MDKQKAKRIIRKILKIIWIIIGIFLTIFLIVTYIKAKTFNGSGLSAIGGAIGVSILFAVTLVAFFIYIAVTLLVLLIRWIIKKRQKK